MLAWVGRASFASLLTVVARVSLLLVLSSCPTSLAPLPSLIPSFLVSWRLLHSPHLTPPYIPPHSLITRIGGVFYFRLSEVFVTKMYNWLHIYLISVTTQQQYGGGLSVLGVLKGAISV